MPTLAELLKAEGLELTTELEAKLPTLTEASDEVRNLVTTKNDLHEWKKLNADKVTGYDNILDERGKALDEKERLAAENGDFKAQLEARDEKLKLQQEIIDSRNKLAIAGSKEAMTAEFAGLFKCSNAGAQFASNVVNVEIDEQGQITKSFVVDGESFTDIKAAKQKAMSIDWMAQQMKAPDANGPTNLGGEGGGYSGKKFKDMNQAERLEFKNNDPLGFSKAIRKN